MPAQRQRKNDASQLTALIRDHYNGVSPLYQVLWGDHVHHGYWDAGGTEPQARAQERLVEELVAFAGVPRGGRVLDVGCGLGGSACCLAERLGCEVVGVTLSPVQADMAARRAKARGVENVRFEVADANDLSFPDASFDAVWNIECSEHLFDKAKFARDAARVLKPGGVLALCAWLDHARTEEDRRLLAEICDRMLCPGLGSLDDYRRWMEAAGFSGVRSGDVSARVSRTWDLCAEIARRPQVRMILPMMDRATKRFVESFPMMQEGFRTGAFAYGLFAGTAKG